MFNVCRFFIGKRKQYKGFCIQFYRLKFEIISFGNKRMYRIEWNDWNED
jgi:hypothetical protein